jgi:hypothetical protein
MRLNPMILDTNADRYYGQAIVKITDRYGKELDNLVMVDWIIFHFEDGQKISISTDWRGQDCYISQRTTD